MSQPRLLTRDFSFLIAAHFLQALGYSTLILFPLYLDHLGASRGEIGTITAVAPLTGLLARPVVAWALDTVGRKPTLLTGTALLVAGMVGIAAVTDLGAVVYIDRAVIGIGLAALFTGYFTWAADLVPAARRTEGIALFGASGLLPIAFNPFVDRIGVAPADLRWFLPIIAAVIALSFAALIPLPERPRPDQAAGRSPYSPRDVVRALRQLPLVPTWLATFVFTALVGMFMTFATVTAASRLPPSDGFWVQPASLWLPYASAALCVRLFGARMPDRIGAYNMIAPALAAYVSACLLMADATQPASFLMAGFLAGLGHGYCFPVLMTQVVTRSPERWRGSAVAAYTAVFGLTELALVPVFGQIADAYDDAVMYSSVGLGAVSLLAVWCALEHVWGVPHAGMSETRTQPPAPAPADG